MSPLTIDRIKKANGKVRIVPLDGQSSVNVKKFAIQILEGPSWVNVFVNHDRQLCEQAVRKAATQIILG